MHGHVHTDPAAAPPPSVIDHVTHLLIAAHMQPRLAVEPGDGVAGPALAPSHASICKHRPPPHTPHPPSQPYSWWSSQEVQLSLNEPNQRGFVFSVVDSEERGQLILDPQWLQSFGDTLQSCTWGGNVSGEGGGQLKLFLIILDLLLLPESSGRAETGLETRKTSWNPFMSVWSGAVMKPPRKE